MSRMATSICPPPNISHWAILYSESIIFLFQKSCTVRDTGYVQCDNSRNCVRKDLFCDGRVNCAWPHNVPAGEIKNKAGDENKIETVQYSTTNWNFFCQLSLFQLCRQYYFTIVYSLQSLKHNVEWWLLPMESNYLFMEKGSLWIISTSKFWISKFNIVWILC